MLINYIMYKFLIFMYVESRWNVTEMYGEYILHSEINWDKIDHFFMTKSHPFSVNHGGYTILNFEYCLLNLLNT